MMNMILAAALAQTSATPATMPPVDAAVERDLQCLAVTVTMAVNMDNKDQAEGLKTLLGYYWGKIEAAAPQRQLNTELARVLQSADLATHHPRCVAEGKAFGERMKDVGNALTKQGL